MKKYISLFMISLLAISLFAQSDDDLFGSSDDDFFVDDGIDIVEDVKAKSDLSKGTIFETGSIKIGGSLNASIETQTVVYADDDLSFKEHLKETDLQPVLDATLSVDARPAETLRIYTKFGFNYPFEKKANGIVLPYEDVNVLRINISDWLKVKEAFTDFSYADRAFFRFGVHTVTWGTGLFFSPVSDIINASSIDPENTSEQVDGVLNLRTQITFPGSQNCLWTYIIPDASGKAIDTGFAGKVDIVLGGWELGLGGYGKYQSAPKGIATISGSIKKLSVFGEFVYQHGAVIEWFENPKFDDKTKIIQGTIGANYMFKDPQIVLAGQYYYNGNNLDQKYAYTMYGHNIAATAAFGKVFDIPDVTANIFGMINIGKKDLPEILNIKVPSAIFSGTINYSPFKECSFGVGPYVTVYKWSENPVVAVKIAAKLGGGKF